MKNLNLKIAVLKIGGRLAVNSRATSGGVNEIFKIFRYFKDYVGKVDFYTKVLPSDEKSDEFNIINFNYDTLKQINKNNYDILMVFNGNANFFGGAEDPLSLFNYMAINKFDGKVIYCLTDLNLILKQIWKVVASKPWGSKYNIDDLKIERDDIYVLSQAAVNNKIHKQFVKNGINLKSKNIFHFPWEQFVVFNEPEHDDVEKEVDIIYGGTFRSGKREKDFIKYYFGYPEDIKVEMFGKIKLEQFKRKEAKELRPPMFSKPLDYNQYMIKTATGLSSIIIADPLYKDSSMRTTRIFECIKANNITFIDKEYYTKTEFFYRDNKILNEFCVVNSRDDVIDRLRFIKNKPEYFDKIIKLQQKAISHITKESYYDNLLKLLENIV